MIQANPNSLAASITERNTTPKLIPEWALRLTVPALILGATAGLIVANWPAIHKAAQDFATGFNPPARIQ